MKEKPQISDTERESLERSDGPKRSRISQAAHKCWSAIRDSSQTVSRALGFSIIVSAFKSLRHPLGQGLEEPTKVALQKNRSVALLRAFIHVIPVGVALWEVTLNIHTYYVGSSALNLVYYQLAAKAHEIMIQASLAAIVLSYFRHQLTTTNGIPFGALFGTLAINQVSYLWSMEFWGSVGSKHLPFRRKLAMVTLISVCFILAAAAGSASVVLLVPRLDYWPAGSTNIWLNATFNDIWPDRLEGSSVPQECASSWDFVTSNECPSSEWQFILDQDAMQENSARKIMSMDAKYVTGLVPRECQLTGKSSYRQFRAAQAYFGHDHSQASPFFQAGYISTTQQAVVADALAFTANLWSKSIDSARPRGHHGSIPEDHQTAAHSITVGYFQPYSVVTCLRDTILGPEDQRPISIPITAGVAYDTHKSYFEPVNSSVLKDYGFSTPPFQVPAIEYPTIVRSQLFQLPGSDSSARIKWVDLPRNIFYGSSIGAVILLPSHHLSSNRSNSTSDILVCNVAAGWGSSALNVTTFLSSVSATSSVVDTETSTVESGDPGAIPNSFQQNANDDLHFMLPGFPSKVVEISQEWAEYLNPWIPSRNCTLIDFFFKAAPGNGTFSHNTEGFGEQILSSLVTNGLARVGFNSQLQGIVKLIPYGPYSGDFDIPTPDGELWYSGKGDVFIVDANESKDWVKLRVNSVLRGYSYNCNGTPPKVAIAFLLTYCVLAISHYFYSGISGISSTCWDSIAEVTTLAMNSTPTAALRNTCAGISEISIFKLPVRILATRDLEGEGEHLELVFGDVDAEQARKTSIKPNRKYGTMPAIATIPTKEQGRLKIL